MSLEGSITRRNGGALPNGIISNICTLLRHCKFHIGKHQPSSPFTSADSDVKPTQIFTSVLRRFFQTISNVKRRRYKGRQSAALDRAVLWDRSPKRKRELESPIYFAFSNFLRFCETKAVVYFAFSFFVAMRGIETTAILTNRSTRVHRESKRNRRLGNRRSEPP